MLIIHVEYIEIKYAIIEISILLFTKSFKKNKIIDDKNGIKANLKIVYRLIFLNPLKHSELIYIIDKGKIPSEIYFRGLERIDSLKNEEKNELK